MTTYSALQVRTSRDEQPLWPADEDTPDTSFEIPLKHKWWIRFGTESLVTIVVGWLAIILGLSVLLIVWAADERNETWKAIVYDNYGPQTVTVSSAAIRTAIGVQSGILTAAIASLILEHCDIPLSQVALLSIVRASTVAPHNVAWSILTTRRYGRAKPLIVAGVLLAVAVTIVSQFISTILLSDFATVAVKGYPYTDNVLYSANFTVPGANHWLTRPPSYPRFAERQEIALQGPQLLDTGTTLRAFLPIRDASDRTALRAYNGPTPILDARVLCVKPRIQLNSAEPVLNSDDLLSLSGVYDAISINATTHVEDVKGALDIQKSPAQDLGTMKFSCLAPTTAAFASNLNYTQWQISICRRNDHSESAYAPALRSPLQSDPTHNVTDVYLLVNTTSRRSDWVGKVGTKRNFSAATFTDNGPWTTAELADGAIALSFSLCFTRPYASNFLVSLSGDKNGSEPILELAGYGNFRTESIRKQLQATGESLSQADRGLFTLKSPSEWTKLGNITRPDTKKEVYASQVGDFVPNFNGLSALMVSESIGSSKSDSVVHPTHVALFQDILRTTQNPALALQALLTVLFSVRYYESFYAFAMAAPGTFTYSTLATAPVRWTGFIIVLIILILHLVLQVVIITLFLARTEHSDIGDSWKAIAQVVSEDTLPAITEAANPPEKHTKAWMDLTHDASGVRFRLVKSEIHARSEITEFESIPRS